MWEYTNMLTLDVVHHVWLYEIVVLSGIWLGIGYHILAYEMLGLDEWSVCHYFSYGYMKVNLVTLHVFDICSRWGNLRGFYITYQICALCVCFWVHHIDMLHIIICEHFKSIFQCDYFFLALDFEDKLGLEVVN